MSQSIENTLFLEDCISKKRTFQDIYESLGLYSESADARKEPVFVKEEANDLHRRVKAIAVSFKGSYRNERERLVADLVRDDAFAKEVQELGASYGHKLWKSAGSWPTRYNAQPGSGPEELYWDDAKDRKVIQFYIRCWITRYVVQTLIPRKGKARASAVSHNISENEDSDTELPRMQPGPSGAASSDLPFRAPEVPGMIPPDDTDEAGASNAQSTHADTACFNPACKPAARSPTTPSKRKALSFQGQPASGKLQKVIRESRAATTSPQQRQRDVFSGPRSPTPIFPISLTGSSRRDQREKSCDTDGTWAPIREGTFESETVVDPDEVMRDTQELLMADIQIAASSIASPAVRSPTAGPSGTYHNSQRQDSVIPPNTQNDADICETNQTMHQQDRASSPDTDLWRSASVSNAYEDVSRLDKWQEKQLRNELFKLLLSFLNRINQFGADSGGSEAEEKMNSLLYQFWVNDAEVLRLKVGDNFTRLRFALERWMNMRHLMAEFRRTSKYFGRPGIDWKEHLRRLDHVAHAKASIAFVELSSFANTGDLKRSTETTFDSDLATVFDLLTQVEGCTGVEEFGALRLYNKDLLAWFT